MWGPTGSISDGILRDYDGEWLLERMECPALFLAGEFDEARPGTNQPFAKRVKRSEFRRIPGAAHATQYDAEEA
ncbi:MAG: alpha/beta hydrolase [Hyphomonadaceae bacterium]|nr:alpha/beta hydrolase [Hyphomonadaceae bacterium]